MIFCIPKPFPTMKTKSTYVFSYFLIALTLTACNLNNASTPEVTDLPPADPSEGLVQAEDGVVTAELVANPAGIAPDGRVKVRVVNRGTRALSYGRPITVEKWNGEAWVETEESRNAMWTMELLHVEPEKIGVEQAWPFLPDQRPESGWYRMTKHVSAESPDPDQDPVMLTIRTRVEVREQD